MAKGMDAMTRDALSSLSHLIFVATRRDWRERFDGLRDVRAWALPATGPRVSPRVTIEWEAEGRHVRYEFDADGFSLNRDTDTDEVRLAAWGEGLTVEGLGE